MQLQGDRDPFHGEGMFTCVISPPLLTGSDGHAGHSGLEKMTMLELKCCNDDNDKDSIVSSVT